MVFVPLSGSRDRDDIMPKLPEALIDLSGDYNTALPSNPNNDSFNNGILAQETRNPGESSSSILTAISSSADINFPFGETSTPADANESGVCQTLFLSPTSIVLTPESHSIVASPPAMDDKLESIRNSIRTLALSESITESVTNSMVSFTSLADHESLGNHWSIPFLYITIFLPHTDSSALALNSSPGLSLAFRKITHYFVVIDLMIKRNKKILDEEFALNSVDYFNEQICSTKRHIASLMNLMNQEDNIGDGERGLISLYLDRLHGTVWSVKVWSHLTLLTLIYRSLLRSWPRQVEGS